MMRLGFQLLAAAMLLSLLALWSRSPAERAPELADAKPEATEVAAAPDHVGPAAPPAAAASPPAPSPAASVPAAEAEPAAAVVGEAEPPARQVATPRLEPEPVEVVSTPGAFSEAPADPWVEASVREEVASDAGSAEVEEAAPDPAPVDVEGSGDLIRRMLVLYDAMRD